MFFECETCKPEICTRRVQACPEQVFLSTLFFSLLAHVFSFTLFANCISVISFYCELVLFRRHNLHTSPHANPMTLRRALTIEISSPTYYVFGMSTLRSSKTLLLTERLSFLKGYQNGSSINADPGGFRVKLYIFSDSGMIGA